MTVTPAVIQPSTSTGDAIPLMVTSTSGRNNAASFRDGLVTSMGLPLVTTGDTYPRGGVLGRQISGVTGSSGFNSLFVHAPTVPSGLQFVVEPGSAIVPSSGASGGYLVDSKTALTLTLDAANASNPRIDRVYLQVSDILALAASTLVQIAVVTGTPAGTPTTPSLPSASTGVQYLDLGTIRVPAAATNLTSATFFDTRRGTSVNGLPRPMLGNDLLTDAGGVPGERRIRYVGAYGTIVDEYGFDNAWHGVRTLIPASAWQNATSNIAMPTANTNVTLWHIAIADPGWAYTYEISTSLYALSANTSAVTLQVHEGTPTATNVYNGFDYVATGSNVVAKLPAWESPQHTGALDLYVTSQASSASATAVFAGGGTQCSVKILPL
jgi:hypothetical protein